MNSIKNFYRRYFVLIALAGLILGDLGCLLSGKSGSAIAAPDCPAGIPVVCENELTGNPPSEWDVSGAGDSSIQGFTTDISVNVGETVRFKIDTPATDYRLDIYRMGYYAGNGARKVATVEPSAALPQDQPLCLTDTSGLIDCGNWAESASWTVPTDATSGIYIAKAIREDETAFEMASHIVFIVRDDASTSDMLFQTSDTTWQAYNDYGGNSLYSGIGPGSGLSGAGRAYKVSYNRPMVVRGSVNEESVFNAEYPMVRWLEANGYDVTYFSGVDSERRGNLISNHNVFLSVGHDEYWSGTQRSHVEAARDAGVHLAFFSGNEIFWKIRWENSIDASNVGHRTLVCYKETHEGAKIDPLPNVWTGTWRDPRFSPPADGGRPENALTGVLFGVNGGSAASTASIKVPESIGKLRFWRNTDVATLASNAEAVLPLGTLGFEWDEDFDNGFQPSGLIRLSATTVNDAPVLVDHGSTFESNTAVHALTLYRDIIGGSLVFGAGTIQWSWGLDANHDRAGTPASPEMQQATVNLFADMGVQPLTLQSGLVAASASTDTGAPVSTIVNPPAGGTVPLASAITISGTASDSGGLVGGVEVSVDGGLTWSAATGRSNWNYEWTSPGSAATVTILSRATDDSLNTESPGAGNTINVISGSDTTPPAVIAQSPIDGSTNVGFNAVVTATFNEAMNAATINTSTVELRNGAALVAATVSYAGNTVTLTPSAALAANTTYAVTVKGGSGGVEDLSGNAMAVDATWQFTTGAQASPNCGTGTNTIWPSTATPAVAADADTSAIELGVKFSSDVDGFICGIRFFKAITNTGTHVGNLWTIGGQLLATAVFTSESNSGWQQVLFANPVAVTAATTYIASYHAPVGQYSLDESYFTGFEQSNGPLQALEDVASGGNGVFLPGAGGFPTNTFRGSNYWVDVVFTGNTGGDTVPPTVSSVTPADGSTGLSTATTVTAVFNEVMEAATVNATNFELRDPGNVLVAASVSLSSTTATLTPTSPLAPNTTYTATIKGGASGVTDPVGNALVSDFSWQFTTAAAGSADCLSGTATIWPDTATPTVVADPDTIAIELGVKFNADVDGFICGIRFYKATTNVGTHVGNLWSADGTLLATATFVNESTSGWQQVNFAAPVAIVANTTYVASYHAPAGRYSVDTGYFDGFQQDNPPLHALDTVTAGGNGVFLPGAGGFPTNSFQGTNYWVDVVFTDRRITDSTPPVVTSRSPVADDTNVNPTTTIRAGFSEALDPVSVTSTSFELRDAGNTLVDASVLYSASGAVLNPTSALAFGSTYTVTLKGGSTGIKDAAGNPLAGDVTWQFTTVAEGPADCLTSTATIWPETAAPATTATSVTDATELGVKFTADADGFICGIRFFKATENVGVHTGNLWTIDGTLLASAEFSNESESGWQQVNFPNPVAVSANTTYVASYHAPVGRYAVDAGYFDGFAQENPPLRALDNATAGGNGVLVTGNSSFPTSSDGANNYWVDVVFSWKPNRAPVLSNPGAQTSEVAAQIELSIQATDLDQDTLIFAASGLPQGLSIDILSGVISGSPTTVSQNLVTVGVSDGNGGSDSVTFSWIIEQAPDVVVVTDTLQTGQRMNIGESLVSNNNQYQLVLQSDGNLVLYATGQGALWSSQTWGSGATHLVLQGDGNLVLYTASGQAVWHSHTFGTPVNRAVLQDDGNFVLYDGSDAAHWSTQTGIRDQINSGESLNVGESLVSRDRRFSLILQSDGNLVLYGNGQGALWSSQTWGTGATRAVLQGDGNFVLYSASGQPVWHSHTFGSSVNRAVLQNDGNFVLYDQADAAHWATNTVVASSTSGSSFTSGSSSTSVVISNVSAGLDFGASDE